MRRIEEPSGVRADHTTIRGLTLSQLCSDAADHVARARAWLYADSVDADRAMLHLDEAITCLKRLLAEGRSPTSGIRTRS
jgi:hypothetical protein